MAAALFLVSCGGDGCAATEAAAQWGRHALEVAHRERAGERARLESACCRRFPTTTVKAGTSSRYGPVPVVRRRDRPIPRPIATPDAARPSANDDDHPAVDADATRAHASRVNVKYAGFVEKTEEVGRRKPSTPFFSTATRFSPVPRAR